MNDMAPSMIGFIDLLGTKESSRVSEDKFYDAIKAFLYTLVTELRELDPGTYSFQYLSDSAFFELEANADSFEFLRSLRRKLFDQRIFFKCALISGRLKPQSIDEEFLTNLVKERSDGYISKSFNIAGIAQRFNGFFFSEEVIKAFILHEEFKGIGFVASKELVSSASAEFVKSIYYLSDSFKSVQPFYDVSFSRKREVATWSETVETEMDVPVGWTESTEFIRNFIASAQISAYKRGAYAKYYLPTLISMIRSSDFTTVQVSDNQISGAPVIYRRLVDGSRRRNEFGGLKGIFDVQCALLDEVLRQVEFSVRNATDREEIQEIEDLTDMVCCEFSNLPRFRVNMQHSKQMALSSRNREVFLERIVRG